MNWFLNWLRRKGRAWALVDFYGDVQMYRYFPLWTEPHTVSRWWQWLPNLMIHLFPGEPGGTGPDGEGSHSHPWPSLGLIVRGSYTEVVNLVKVRCHRALGLALLKSTDWHRITAVTPGTISIFMHGFRRRAKWSVLGVPCAKKCDACATRGLSCIKPVGPADMRDNYDDNNVHHHNMMTWVQVTPEFEAQIKYKKLVLKRKFKVIPITNSDKAAAFKEASAKEFCK